MSTPEPSLQNAPTQNERTWGMVAHLSAFALFIVPFFGNVLAPLVIWLIHRDRSPFVAQQAKEALNFNITIAAGWLICLVLVLLFVGFLLGIALLIYWLVMTISAAVKVSEGVDYRYPYSIRFVQ